MITFEPSRELGWDARGVLRRLALAGVVDAGPADPPAVPDTRPPNEQTHPGEGPAPGHRPPPTTEAPAATTPWAASPRMRILPQPAGWRLPFTGRELAERAASLRSHQRVKPAGPAAPAGPGPPWQ